MAKDIIIDTDPGIDDAIAIFLALAVAELNVLGLTTIFGNADTATTTRNAQLLLDIANRADIPVAEGASRPLAMDYLGPVPHVHGHNGLGEAALPSVSTPTVDVDAVDWLYEQVRRRPNDVTILTLGPLTNLALALARYPDFSDLVAEIVVMGGNALVPGNATPAAEANILNDPEAADQVFGGNWEVSMVGLDVSEQVVMPGVDIERISHPGKETTRFLGEAVPHYRRFFEKTNGLDGIYLHDPTAVVYLLEPGLFRTRRCPLRAETEGMSRGKTWPSFGNTDDSTPAPWRDRPLVNICTEVASQSVIDLVVDALS